VSKIVLLFLPLLAAAISYAIIALAMPLLARYALARPNARSSHSQPTPQGGGIAVVGTTLILSLAIAAVAPGLTGATLPQLMPLAAGATLLALVGAIDDIRPLSAAPRLVWQFVAVVAVVLTMEARIAPGLPLWLERALAVITLLWFLNLVNFMDGIDWMSVAEFVPLTGALIILHWLDRLPEQAVLPSYALFGALIGFAPFNRPVAKLFLGDVGSLPIGLIAGWLLIALAAAGHVAAALLLPLYYLMDATTTLLRRLGRGENVMQAHRSHFYQRATDGGYTVPEIIARVFALNVVLAALALATTMVDSFAADAIALAVGAALTAGLLALFTRGRR
jgi:UDP-N-acetylmuramyl pentapeptide phosphotransferase/UDP-N-acetylglucosamine-1-phosphate transferase